ncbi:hypothetical protein BZA77DRAFT_345796 [Pyronema omphalodes]|nr:hypothetical protein BZA77DRAFT_345796 [Pyronema omphalodes]
MFGKQRVLLSLAANSTLGFLLRAGLYATCAWLVALTNSGNKWGWVACGTSATPRTHGGLLCRDIPATNGDGLFVGHQGVRADDGWLCRGVRVRSGDGLCLVTFAYPTFQNVSVFPWLRVPSG